MQFAALDLVQHGLAGHSEGFGGVVEPEPALGDLGLDAVAESLVDPDPPGRAGGDLLTNDETLADPAVEGDLADAQDFLGGGDGDHDRILASRSDIVGFWWWLVGGDAVVGAQGGHAGPGEGQAGGGCHQCKHPGDLHSRAVVGWAIADHMRTDLVTAALDMALARRSPADGVIFHSDRGTQYTSTIFAEYCAKNKIRRSLGRTGICFDNAVSESFFATYKKELIHVRPWPTIAHLKKETFDWIETYYNTQRRHSTLGYLTPQEYELGYRDISQIAA